MKKQTILYFLLLITTASFSFGQVILNEYNAVRSSRWLDEDGAAASAASDASFGRVQGNGGRWFELLVVGETSAPGETVDMRGWSFDWTDSDLGSGTITLTSDSRLENIHRGTLLTFFAKDDGTTSDGTVNPENVATNIADYDPNAGNWWLNLNLADSDFIASGSLDTGNDDWQLEIFDSSDNVVFGPAGEGIGANITGINSREVGKLESFANFDVPTASMYQGILADDLGYTDGTSSTFGSENIWSGGAFSQDLSSLRAIPEPSTFVLLALAGFAACVGLRRRLN